MDVPGNLIGDAGSGPPSGIRAASPKPAGPHVPSRVREGSGRGPGAQGSHAGGLHAAAKTCRMSP